MLICQLSDLHVRAPGNLSGGSFDTNAMVERAMAAVAALDPKPDALMVTGDLVDHGKDAEYTLFLALAQRRLNLPIYVIPGNHDQRAPLRRVLGGLPGMTGVADGFIQYVVDSHPVRLVMLDTMVAGEPHGELCETRLAFLEASLAAAPDRPTMIAMHHPPFACGIDFMDRTRLRNPDPFAEIVSRHQQVRRIVCGHVHRSAVGQVAHVPAWIVPSVGQQLALRLTADAPGALVMEPPGFALHRWTEQEGLVSHLAYINPYPGPFALDGA